MTNARSKAARNNRANQLNLTHPTYYRMRGASQAESSPAFSNSSSDKPE